MTYALRIPAAKVGSFAPSLPAIARLGRRRVKGNVVDLSVLATTKWLNLNSPRCNRGRDRSKGNNPEWAGLIDSKF